ncbi:MAG: 3-oxoacyl-ACP reductase FabG [Bacteroidales bacterium]|nr:3-oxoacyl-ACP reductase FabG [Bacteroidales bacterium]MDE6146460.1 3-oxoacyl-ACP reductase FabG [Bacteroidales bacterium]
MKRYALVTGGSRGIGRAVSLRLAREGYHVIVNYVSNEKEAARTLEMIESDGGTGELLAFDVSDRAAVSQALDAWAERNRGCWIEVLVNNAGIRRDGLLLWMEDRDWDSVLGIGLDGFFNVTKPLLKSMLVKKYGRIINIASLSGLKGLPGQCNYSAAKGGLIAATKALAQEVGRKGVTVNAVAPGFIKTDMTEGLDEAELKKTVPLNRFGEPEEVAALVAFLASRESGYITGECISINGGLY